MKSVPFTDIERVQNVAEKPPQYLEDVRTLQVGFGSKVLRADQRGIWLGGVDPTTAPFSVDMDGNMIANSVTLTGYIAIGGALSDVGAGNVTSTYIGSNAITTSKIAAQAVTASEIDVADLFAQTIVATGSITGALIRTSSSGDRVELDDVTDTLKIYDPSGLLRIKLNNDSIIFNNSGESLVGQMWASTTNFFIDSTNSMSVNATNVLLLTGQGSSITLSTNSISLSDHVYFNNRNLYTCGNIRANDTTSDIGTSTTYFDNLYIKTINMEGGLMNLSAISGATAGGLASSNGSMYYRTDDNTVRVKVGGVWKTVQVV